MAKKTTLKTVKRKKAAPDAARRPGRSPSAGRKAKPVTKNKAAAKSTTRHKTADQRASPKTAGRSTRSAATSALPRSPSSKLRPPMPRHLAKGAVLTESLPLSPPAQPLTPDEVGEFREALLKKRAEILGDVTTLQRETLNKNRRDASGDLSSMPIHMADLGSDNYELEFTLGLIEGERAMLKEIEEALERIKNGTYGVCLATGRAIGKARLRAKPWAKYCYEYTLAQETGQARRY